MQTADWLVLVLYLLGTVGIGVMLGRRVHSTSDLFSAGGASPWWASGLSAFMTMFSANTFVVWGGMAYQHGLVAIMVNLCYGVAALLAGFTVAGKWKRLGVRTPAEFVERRFGKGALHFYTWSMMIYRMVGSAGELYAIATLTVAVTRGNDTAGTVQGMPTELVTATASSHLHLTELASNDSWIRLDASWAMLVPMAKGTQPSFSLDVSAEKAATLLIELRRSWKDGNFTPEELLETLEIPLIAGESHITASFTAPVTKDGYYFLKLCEDPSLNVRASDVRVTGVVAVTTAFNKAVAKSSVQEPPADIGIDRFEFWLPKRRPQGHNLAMTFEPPIDYFGPANVLTGPARPVDAPNAWVADPADPAPALHLTWDAPVALGRVRIAFDPDWDHPMESVLMTHPEEVVPFMVKDFDLRDEAGQVLHSVRDHHSANYEWLLAESLLTNRLTLRILSTHGAPAAVFRVSCFAK